jgi:hypothetical protein
MQVNELVAHRMFDEVIAEIDEVEARLQAALERTPLPAEPDRAAVDAFLVDAYRRVWAGGSNSRPRPASHGRGRGARLTRM